MSRFNYVVLQVGGKHPPNNLFLSGSKEYHKLVTYTDAKCSTFKSRTLLIKIASLLQVRSAESLLMAVMPWQTVKLVKNQATCTILLRNLHITKQDKIRLKLPVLNTVSVLFLVNSVNILESLGLPHFRLI